MKRISISMIALIALATGAQAQGFGGGQALAVIDSNHDGFAQRTEVEAAMARRFARLDTDGNGSISAAEFDAPVETIFAAVDADHDSALSRTEIRGKLEEVRALFGLAAR
jgi:hypothetical protein